jgi:hypothetical protein
MLWQKLLIERPLQVLRLLWANRGAAHSTLTEKITWRKVVFVAALLVAAIAIAQMFSLDLAFLMAGDIAFYCEIAAAMMFVAVRGHIRQSVHTAKLALTHGMRRARTWRRRYPSARRRRDITGPTAGDKGADDDGGWSSKSPDFALQSWVKLRLREAGTGATVWA